MKSLFTVLRKELVETLRDRRTVFNALIFGPLLGPAIMIGLIALIGAKATERAEKRLELPVVGAERAPNLVAWMEARGVTIEKPPQDVDRAIREQDEDVVLAIDAEYATDWRASRPAKVELVHDASRQEAQTAVRRVEGLLEAYDRQVGALRLVARGVHPGVSAPLAIAHRDLSTPQSRAGMVLSFLPYFLILGGFLGGAHLAIDATAGERERQSLEPLLATPSSRGAIMSGKLLATSVFALTSLALTLIAFKVAFALFPTQKLGIKLDLSTLAALKLFVILVPIVVFGSALLTSLAAFAKSYKEAQSYMSLLMLLPMIPSLVLLASPVKTQLWMLSIPFLAQNQLITKVVRGEPVLGMEWLVGLGAGLVVAAAIWFVAARLYHREQLAISG